ncbi:protein transporter [Panus rudis PR-1116 ss-1]|nr:protein transporter [Panus rudis PR-1116 ss-1]
MVRELRLSAPKIIVQIALTGGKILGKALFAAGRQAIQNAKYRPDAAAGGDVAGLRNATSGSITDKLTREHRMTLDEARLILNVKKEDPAEKILQHYQHLFKQNSPPDLSKLPKPQPGKRHPLPPAHSHYLQSKVVRAKERIEAELKAAEAPAQQPQAQPSASAPPPSETPSNSAKP